MLSFLRTHVSLHASRQASAGLLVLRAFTSYGIVPRTEEPPIGILWIAYPVGLGIASVGAAAPKPQQPL